MIVDERIAAYIQSLEGDMPTELRKIEKEAIAEYVPIIKKPTQSLLRFLLHMKKPLQILEVGTAVGFSSGYMSYYTDDTCHITTIEKVQQRIDKAKENYKTIETSKKIQLLEGDAAEVLHRLAFERKEYEFIFMDAAKGQYLNFLPDILVMLKTDGLLVSDNVLQDGDVAESRYAVTRRNRTIHSRMRNYLYTLTHSEQLETIVLPIGDGVAISRKIN